MVLVLLKPFQMSYPGVGHQMGLDPLCGTLQSPSQSARTSYRRNNMQWTQSALSCSSTQILILASLSMFSNSSSASIWTAFGVTRGFHHPLRRVRKKDLPLVSYSSPTLQNMLNPRQHPSDAQAWCSGGTNIFYLPMSESQWCSATLTVKNYKN